MFNREISKLYVNTIPFKNNTSMSDRQKVKKYLWHSSTYRLEIKGTNILTCASVTQRKDLKIREKRTKSMQTVIYVTEVSEMKKDANAKIES